jgi:hypothetical protein
MRCVPVDQMWRGKLSDLDTSALEHGRGIVADGAFAIGASDVYGFPRKLDIL